MPKRLLISIGIGVGGVALFALVAAFLIGLVPSVPDLVREPVATAMLRHRSDENSFERFLRMSGADWHIGGGYQDGESYSSFNLLSQER
jgi:hypothetical protein